MQITVKMVFTWGNICEYGKIHVTVLIDEFGNNHLTLVFF